MARVVPLALALSTLISSLAPSFLAPAGAQAQRRGRRDSDAGPGTLVLQAAQEGAEVFVDELPIGTTPLDPIPLAPGAHTLRVRLPGHTEYTDVVQITPGQTSEVPVELIPLSQVLSVVTEPPGAHVYVDGDFMGESPVELDLLEGTRSVRIVLRGYREVIREIEAHAGRRDELQLQLEPLPPETLAAATDTAEWYEEPVTWIAIGGGAVALAIVISVVAVTTSSSASGGQVDQFCALPGGCVRVDTW